MIYSIEGRLVELNPAYAVIECSGIAYQLHISLYTFEKLGGKKEARLLVHTSVNQNDFSTTAYGFIEEEERILFRQLLSVSGVGAGSARMCLSSYPPSELVSRIAGGDVPALKRVKGIGEKTAQRIIVDLKDKIGKASGIQTFTSEKNTGIGYNKTREEALGALVILGFARNQAEKAVDRCISAAGAEQPVEEIIKQALKHL